MGYESKLKELNEQLLDLQLDMDNEQDPEKRAHLTNKQRLLRDDRDALIGSIKTLYLGSINKELEG